MPTFTALSPVITSHASGASMSWSPGGDYSPAAEAYASCRLATTWLKSRSTSSATVPSNAPRSAFIPSIARRAWSRSRVASSSLAKPSWASVAAVESRRSETFMFFTASSSSSGVGCGVSAANGLLRPHLLRVDLLERRALLVPGDLALRGVRSRDREKRGHADLVGDGLYPLDQLFHALALLHQLARLEINEVPRQAPADRTPEVLLDQPVRRERERLALVERPCGADGEGVAQRRERAGIAEIGLSVADADLDRRVREMRPDAPPHLGVLVDRAGAVEEAHVALELGPAAIGVRDATARKELREDLGAHRVQVREDVLEERRARRERQQLGQQVP